MKCVKVVLCAVAVLMFTAAANATLTTGGTDDHEWEWAPTTSEENSVVGWWESTSWDGSSVDTFADHYGHFWEVWTWDPTNTWHDGTQSFDISAQYAGHKLNHIFGLVNYSNGYTHTPIADDTELVGFTSNEFGFYLHDGTSGYDNWFYTDPDRSNDFKLSVVDTTDGPTDANKVNPGTYDHNAWVFEYHPVGDNDLRHYTGGATYLMAWEDLPKYPTSNSGSYAGWGVDPTVSHQWVGPSGHNFASAQPQWCINDSQEWYQPTYSSLADNNDMILFLHASEPLKEGPVPEPASCVLLVLAAAGIGAGLRRRVSK